VILASPGKDATAVFRAVFSWVYVVVAKGDEGPKFERDLLGEGFGTAHVPELVLNYRRVLAVHHKDRLLDLDAFDLVGKYREGIKAKFLEIAKPLGCTTAG